MNKISIYETTETDPYWNLALEEYLLLHVDPGECILYLWQNQHTVVIGRNQNAWKECDISRFTREGGRLARRLSGGGAVYHDLGNLNFTFLARKADYSVPRQLQVIKKAVESFGIPVEISGRNDLLAEGRKFSGNAFYESGDCCYHHGTLLVDVDTERMSRYLTVSQEKLRSKGVDSVRSRVGNLKELSGDITIDGMKAAMEQAFCQVYGQEISAKTDLSAETERFPETSAEKAVSPETETGMGPTRFTESGRSPKDSSHIRKKLPPRAELRPIWERISSWEWIYGRRIPFTVTFEKRFSWGSAEVELEVNGGVIRDARIYSDALELSVAELAEKLRGCRCEREALRQRVLEQNEPGEPFRRDLAQFLWEATG